MSCPACGVLFGAGPQHDQELATMNADGEDRAAAGDAWTARAPELADWAWQFLVNRRDIHGGQWIDREGVIHRTTRHDELTHDWLVRHFTARETEDVIGLHCVAPDETCRWLGIDIDRHDGQGACPEANLRFARAVRNSACRSGLDVRLLDSSGGRGGFHLWVVFDRPIPMADARRLALWLVRGWAEHGLPKRPDLFPGNDHLTGKLCGTWLRLPGRHHKRDTWASVWSPRRRAWRTGDEAIDALLTLRGRPIDVAAIVPADFDATPPGKSAPSRPDRHGVSVPASPRVWLASSISTESGGPATGSPERHGRAGHGGWDLRLARAALEHYRNDDLDYDDWLEVGMALRNLDDPEAAFELWDDWSSDSAKYDATLTAAKWESFRPADERGGIGLGSLFLRAMDAGWPGPAFAVSEDALGTRRMTHRSGRRGRIVVPARKIVVRRPAQ
jgi:hypothetical protein